MVSPPDGFFYKELSLYECLLANLNGKVVSQSQPDEGFVTYSHSSPAHTWQVIDQSFRYLLRHFIGDLYQSVYQQLLTGFKLFLMETSLDIYQNGKTDKMQQYHFLLQEMCRNIAQQALDQGSDEQKEHSFQLISKVKAAVESKFSSQEQSLCSKSKLREVQVASLSFPTFHLKQHTPTSRREKISILQGDPFFFKPSLEDDILDYLEHFKHKFVAKLVDAQSISKTALLSHGIEVFFIDYLAQTNILKKCINYPFSRDDIYLASSLVALGEIFYGCQGRLAKHFLADVTYEPRFYAKNIIIQFFVYAAVAALNYRDPGIGPLLATVNLSAASSSTLSLTTVLPHLVIEDSRWLKVLTAAEAFFTPIEGRHTLFSFTRFQSSSLNVEILNNAQETDFNVAFAYTLLQNYIFALTRFLNDNLELEAEKLNKQWVQLTYSSIYLPPLYCLLTKVSHFAKASLSGFVSNLKSNLVTAEWSSTQKQYWFSTVSFKVNGCSVRADAELSQLSSHRVKSNCQNSDTSHQRIISCKGRDNSKKIRIHLKENEIIASQDKKPETLDYNRYLRLGFVQSEQELKLQRFYIALKEHQLDFTSEHEGALIKQTLFEIGLLTRINEKACTLLEWTARRNPELIHALGLLLVKKAQEMKCRVTQHQAMGDILLVALGLLTFYPPKYKNIFVDEIISIYDYLKEILAQPQTHLRDLLHLNAYLIISLQAKPQILETEVSNILKALLAIQKYKVKGIKLNNNWLLRVHEAIFTWSSQVWCKIAKDPEILEDLILSVVPQWDRKTSWQKSHLGLLFTCYDYTVEPLKGCIYFKNQPIMGLPYNITEHELFKNYLGKENFAVIPSSCRLYGKIVPCYVSVDRMPETRLTLINDVLLVEEKIEGKYQRFIPVEEILRQNKYPQSLFELPCNKGVLRHWLTKNGLILIKDQYRQVIFEWDLEDGTVLSLQHNGYIVPWDQLPESYFKTWLANMESPDWIELIAHSSSNKWHIHIKSLSFPRFGIHFDYKQGKFFSKQIHGYVISEKQHLNTLHGFSNYLILQNREQNSASVSTKVIIPHRKVKSTGPFYKNTATVIFNEVQSPAYFVYDFDPKLGLLKGHHIRAQLYLALMYFRSASRDVDEVSHCDAYHLARQNLEQCWKDEPYDETELSIIKQFLKVNALRDFHSHRIALYLKVASLLISSLHLAFLYTGESIQQNIEKSNQLLEKEAEQLQLFLSIYLQNKSTISARIRLSVDEEEDIIKYCPSSSSNEEKNHHKQDTQSFEEYYQLHFKKQEVLLPMDPRKPFNNVYRQLFSRKALQSTAFIDLFTTHISLFSFAYDTDGINFSSGINNVLLSRFRLTHFITLYDIARSSTLRLTKYRYLLHYLVLRANVSTESFPVELRLMLARALLLVAEKPSAFPASPYWFNKSHLFVDLSKRQVDLSEIYQAFPPFQYRHRRELTYEENGKVRAKELEEYKKENQQIWLNLNRFDLDEYGKPRCLPQNVDSFELKYEPYVHFIDGKKRDIVRQVYLQAAYNDAMFDFFSHVLEQCERLKNASAMGWQGAPFTFESITVTVKPEEECSQPTPKPVDLEKWAIPPQPLIDLNQFFAIQSQPGRNEEFLFEPELSDMQNGYQHQFYTELKDSWLAFHEETKCSYDWLSTISASKLESVLQTKNKEIHVKAIKIWEQIIAQFKEKSSSKSNDYFALRWYSGQVTHYHKQDLLALLIEPHKLASYNPDCLQKRDSIIQDLLQYIILEINSAKTVRLLALTEQYKHAKSKPEKFSVLQGLVKGLQENLDPVSYRYPHWFLFQYENGLIVRDNQCELIVSMLDQTDKAMYQLNMGEGKSSVILPLLSYNLADGKQLLRINVLSALLNTMKDFLRQRFSGLIRKRIYTLPFNRDTEISTSNLTSILERLKTCQYSQHILLVTPEHRLCLQLKTRELLLENQQQMGATNIFNWKTYRLRAERKTEVYDDLTQTELNERLLKQDQCLRKCLRNEGYIDSSDRILKVPPRGQGRLGFARFKEKINDLTFREWSCLKAAYCELLYNSTLAFVDCSEKLKLLNEINAITAIDLLDESDEILKHGTELNYTVGEKYVFAGGELRWQVPQFFIKAIFCDLELRDIILAGKSSGFSTVNLDFSPRGGVPFVQLIDESYYESTIKPLLLQKFFQENLPTLRKYHTSADSRLVQGEESSLRSYVAGQLKLSTEKKVLAFLADKGPLKAKILIAKGWLSHGILFHVFSAKYRVQFGLNLRSGQTPKQIAVPFLGKDTPSPRSEFSHPDVMLGFTIISYLYQGLSQKQLKESLVKLKGKFSPRVADDLLSTWADAGQAWIKSQTGQFPPLLLTSLENIDLADDQCIAQAHQYLAGNYSTIFFYLNQFVLMEEAMQYCWKISANSHSLVGYDAALGFSGTDDRKITMPFQIKSLCSTTQKGTNGKLLSVLTQEWNSSYYSIQTEDTIGLLKELCRYVAENPNCHALIDAGALVTGLTNYDVAEFLLFQLPDTFVGLLYFSDDGNSLVVQTRDGKTTPLQDCYLDKRNLFAYLDDIHTRGTDIQLPLNCHAILTVGMGMLKDKLMQAAMRLRQLAEKQSVSLWGTQAVTLAISRDNSIEVKEINSLEVIKWVTRNTIKHINQDLFPVAARKISFQFLRKAEAWLKEAPTTLDTLIQCCQEKEMFQLDEFFALSPQLEDLADRLNYLIHWRIKKFWQELEVELQRKGLTGSNFYKKVFDRSEKNKFKEELCKICEEVTGFLQPGYVHQSLDEDEEKEVELEIVQEQEVLVKTELRDPHPEEIWEVRLVLQENFIRTAQNYGIIMPLSGIKRYVQVPALLKNITWHSNIFMTTNFIQSVETRRNESLDNYLRPVDVVLMHRSVGKSSAVLLSGQEAARIKSVLYRNLDGILLIHIYDVNGPTQEPTGSVVSKEEQKLLTIIKLFSGECHYTSSKEVLRLAKRVGRIHPHYFKCIGVTADQSEKLHGILIGEGYLDFAGVMTVKLLNVMRLLKSNDRPLTGEVVEYQMKADQVSKNLQGIFNKLVIQSSGPLQDNHYVLWQWVGTRRRLREYPGSFLESIINPENQIKCPLALE